MSDRLKDLLNIILASVGMRLIFPYLFYLINPQFIMSNSIIPFFDDADSYYFFVQYGRDIFAWLIPHFIFLLGLCYFYFILKDLKANNPVILTLMLSFFPVVYQITTLVNMDRHIIIFGIFSILIYNILKIYDNPKLSSYCIVGILFIMINSIWGAQGFIGVLIITVLCVLASIPNLWLLSGIGLLGAILFFNKIILQNFAEYFVLSRNIQELNSIMYLPFYILLIVALLVILQMQKKDAKLRFLIAGLIAYASLGIFFMRFLFFAVFFIIIMLGFIDNELQRRFNLLMLYMFIVSVIAINLTALPLIEREQAEIISGLEYKEIIGAWHYGHVYQAFAKGNVKFKAVPDRDLNDHWDRAEYSLLNSTPEHYLILDDDRLPPAEKLINYTVLYHQKGVTKDMLILQPKR